MKPLQANDRALIDAYDDLLSQNTQLIPIAARIAHSAAELLTKFSCNMMAQALDELPFRKRTIVQSSYDQPKQPSLNL